MVKKYKIVTEIEAEQMDRDTAGNNGYLDYFNADAPIDKTEGYAYLNALTGHIQWAKKEEFESMFIKNYKR